MWGIQCVILWQSWCDAEVINAIAFDMELGALDYTEKEDGTVVLARQKLLEVTHASALPPLPCAWTNRPAPLLASMLLYICPCLVYCCHVFFCCASALFVGFNTWHPRTAHPLLQDSKQFQSDLSLTFSNPMYALLLVLCPWLERAKQRKATAKALADVSTLQLSLWLLWKA